jgi:Ca2+-binding RTX toxin-like protein
MSRRRLIVTGCALTALLLTGAIFLSAASASPTPCTSSSVLCIDQGLEAYVKTLAPSTSAGTPGFDASTVLGSSSPLAQGSADANAIEQAFTALAPTITQDMNQAANTSGETLAEYQAALDDLDGNGDPTKDFSSGNFALDIQGTISPQSGTGPFTITLTLNGALTMHDLLSLPSPQLTIAPPSNANSPMTGTVTLSSTATFTLDASGVFSMSPGSVGTLSVSGQADYGSTSGSIGGDTNPVPFAIGPLSLTGKGTAQISSTVDISAVDPDGDGKITLDEMQAQGGGLFQFGCKPGGTAVLHLTVSSDLAGLTASSGSVDLSDSNVCDGISGSELQVSLGQLGDFSNISSTDLVDELATLTTSLRTLEQAGDLKLPFLDTSLSQLPKGANVAAPLIKFFTDNNLDPSNPQFDPTKLPDLATLTPLAGSAGLAAKLAQSLGISTGALNPRFSGGKLLFDIHISEPAPSPAPKIATIDLGNELSGAGLVSVKGTASASATVSPSWTLNLTIGVDLSPGITRAQRAFFQTGGTQFSADAPVSASVALTGSAGPLSVSLMPSSGCTSLLARANTSSPMLSVALNGDSSNELTVDELTQDINTGTSPLMATVNAKVPSCHLSATAALGGQTLASGTVGFSWPDITQPSGFKVTAASGFEDGLLQLAFNNADPTVLLKGILAGVRGAAGELAGVASGNSTFGTSLPLLGGSIRDLVPYFQQLHDTFDSLVASDQSQTLDQLQTAMQGALEQLFGVGPTKASKMLTISLVPATSTARAAVMVEVRLGICTSDRVGAACLVTHAPIKKAFTLRLGPDDTSSVSVVGAGTSGQVAASFDASADIKFGIELPSVTLASGAGGQPTVSGAPVPFVLDTSNGTVGVGASVNGTLSGQFGPDSGSIGTSGDPATGCLAVRLNLEDPSASGQRLIIPSAALSQWASGLVQTPLHESGSLACPDGNDASASLPLYVNGSKLGTATFTAPDILDPPGWQFDDGGIVNGIASGDLNFQLLLAGLNQTATLLQQKLAELQGKSIPLIGDHLGAASQMVEDFKTNVIAPVQSAVNTFNAKTQAGALASSIQSFLWNHVGQGSSGADLILPTKVKLASAKASGTIATFTTTSEHGFVAGETVTVSGVSPSDYDGTLTVKAVINSTTFTADLGATPSGPATTLGSVRAPRIIVDMLCPGTGTSLTPCAASAPVSHLQRVEVTLALGQQAEATQQPFDAGFPGLQLKSQTTMNATATWSFDLTFGIDRTQGFFISSDNHVDRGAPEIAVTGSTDLGGGSISGDIAFIPVSLTDNHDGPDAAVRAGLDLRGGNQDQATGDHLITVDQLTNFESPSGWSLGPSFEACANAQLGLKTQKDPNDSSSLPTISAQLGMDGGINCTDSTGLGTGGSGSSFNIHFDKVQLDLGSWVSGFLKPAVDKLHKFLGPIEPMVNAIESPVPGISDASELIGQGQVSWYDILKAQNGGDDLALLGNIITLVNIDQALQNADAGQIAIPIGSFDVNVSQAGVVPAAPACGGFLSNCQSSGSVIDQALGNGAVSHALKQLLSQSTQSGFSFPAFQDPKLLFGLLLGQNPTLIQYDAGPLNATAAVNFSFPLGPLTLGVNGSVTAKGHFVAGYDTQGIRDALQQLEQGKSISAGSSLLNGLYVNGHDASGQDVPELELDAQIGASAGFGVTLNASIIGKLDANLITPPDGKLRIATIEQELSAAHGNPVCLFTGSGTVSGQITADLPAGLDSWTIADATLYQLPDLTSFCEPGGNANNQHGTVLSDGTLDISPSAGGTTSNDDVVTLTSAGSGAVKVTEASGGSEATTTFSGVTQVFVDGGAGDDTIQVQSGGPSPEWSLPLLLCGGDGSDTITGGPGADRLYGDGGGRMTSSAGPLVCSSTAAGNDTLIGQGGADQLFGGAGNDVLVGDVQPGMTLDGLAGYNRLDGGADDDTLIGAGHDRLIGGSGSDTIDFSAWTKGLTVSLIKQTVTTNDGAPVANLSGIEDAIGGSGDDFLFGGYGSNRLEGGPGNDFIQGDDSGATAGTPGGDYLSGGAGNDQIFGSGGEDTIYGGPGDDQIADGAGNDTIDGGDNCDTVDQGTSPNGADTIFDDGAVDVCASASRTGGDIVDYSHRPSGSIAHVTPASAEDGYANDGAAGEHDNIESGIEKINAPS